MKVRINPIVAEDLMNIKEYIAEDNVRYEEVLEMLNFRGFLRVYEVQCILSWYRKMEDFPKGSKKK